MPLIIFFLRQSIFNFTKLYIKNDTKLDPNSYKFAYFSPIIIKSKILRKI